MSIGKANTPTAVKSPQNSRHASVIRHTSIGTDTDTLHAAKRTAFLKLSAIEDARPMRMLDDISCLTEYAVG